MELPVIWHAITHGSCAKICLILFFCGGSLWPNYGLFSAKSLIAEDSLCVSNILSRNALLEIFLHMANHVLWDLCGKRLNMALWYLFLRFQRQNEIFCSFISVDEQYYLFLGSFEIRQSSMNSRKRFYIWFVTNINKATGIFVMWHTLTCKEQSGKNRWFSFGDQMPNHEQLICLIW